MNNKKERNRITVYLPTRLYQQLDELKQRLSLNLSHFVMKAIEVYMVTFGGASDENV